jgi:Big-like domain-containing protein
MQHRTCAAAVFAVSLWVGAAAAQQGDSTTQLASSLNPSVFGHAVTFTATVTALAPGSRMPTGTVSFFDGSNVIGSGRLNGAGQATFTTSSLFVGSHSIVAGPANFDASQSNFLKQNVTWGAAR